MRCSVCGINYPLKVKKCRQCQGDTWSHWESEPDLDQLTPATPELDGMKMANAWRPPTIEPPPLIVQDRIIEFNGQCWISDAALDEAGYRGFLREGSVIRFYPRVGNAEEDAIWFELAGRARHKTLGDLAGWWLQRLPSPEEMFADLPVTEGTDDDGRPT